MWVGTGAMFFVVVFHLLVCFLLFIVTSLIVKIDFWGILGT